MAEMRVVDADVVEQKLAPIIDDALARVAAIAAGIVDNETRTVAVDLGVRVKTAMEGVKAEREEVYEPLAAGVEVLRNKFDDRIKKAKAALLLLNGGVTEYDRKEKRKAELLREAAAAEARRIQDEAAKKRREAEEAEARAKQAIEDEKRRKKEAQEADERRIQAEADEKARQERVRREAEQAELDRKRDEEAAARLAHAQVAEEVGNGNARVDNVLSSPTPIAPVMASPQRDLDKKSLDAQQLLADKSAAEKAERERVDSEAAAARQKEAAEAAAKARKEAEDAEAAAAAAAAAAVATTYVPTDDRTRKSTTWKWQIRDKESFLKLAKAVADGRAPVEFLGFLPDKPEKFRPAAIGVAVVKDKEEFKCDGIETWPEESTSFKAAE